ncbi:hypothetical protein EWM64_g415 [Hericium alpestre]|uniref:F-box domain-containing protein n=1 Tax=Hericium alpestre TaxID=135208 RepID=A0A4Z0AAM5_9AGAM|nr:hypothetical protein EWM64_g415 [Hericium alpestre]
MSFLSIPRELRLVIYDQYFAEHRHVPPSRIQPYNDHIRLLRVCRLIAREAAPLFRSYISLRNEHQITAFLCNASSRDLDQIVYADVANDSRVYETDVPHSGRSIQAFATRRPVSNLHLVLHRHHLPAMISLLRSVRLRFEPAMFPGTAPALLSLYELYVDPETRSDLFQVVSPHELQSLRISGHCQVPGGLDVPALRHLTLHNPVTNDFDIRDIHKTFVGCQLESFAHAFSERLAFELRDKHLPSIVTLGPHLRKLVLLGCSRLSSDAITSCIAQLPCLEYLALSIYTAFTGQLGGNFIEALPNTIQTMKLAMTVNRKFLPSYMQVPSYTRIEQQVRDTFESRLLRRSPAPNALFIFLDTLDEDISRRWTTVAADRGIRLRIGRWDDEEEI